MKKRVMAVFLLLALLLSACGTVENNESAPSTEELKPSVWYTADCHSLDLSTGRAMDLCLSGDRVWCSVDKDEKCVLLTWKTDGSDYRELGCWVPPQELLESLPEDAQVQYTGIYTLLAGPEGSLLGIVSFSYTAPDPDNPIRMSDGSTRPGSLLENRTFAACLDENIQTRFWYELTEYSPMVRPQTDSEGNLYLPGDQALDVYDTEGQCILHLPMGGQGASLLGSCGGLVRLADGSVAAGIYTKEGFRIRPVDLKSGKLLDGPTIQDTFAQLFSGAYGWQMLVNTGSVLYGLNLDGTQGPVLTWLNLDLDGNLLIDLAADPTGESAVALLSPVRTSGSTGNSMIARVSRSDQAPSRDRIVLTLACMELDSDVAKLVLHFNRTDPEYRIEVMDYSVYNSPSARDAGYTILNAEIATGEIPDLFATKNLSIRTYGDRGLLEDLWPWIDGDAELGGREALMTPVFDAISQGGPLYQVTPSFGINTLIGSKEIVGDHMGWSLDEFYAAAEKMPEGASLMPVWFARQNALTISVCMRLDDFVDRENAVCRFDSQEFRDLVRFTECFPVESRIDPSDQRTEYQRVIERDQMLLDEYLDCFDSVIRVRDFLGEQVVYVGFPGASGNGSAFEIQAGLAMSSSCAYKEGAWRFLRLMLDPEMQLQLSDDAFIIPFPTNRSAFEKQLEKEMKAEYKTNPDGTFILDRNGEKIPKPRGGRSVGGSRNGPIVFIYPMTLEEADRFLELINTTTCVRYWDDSVMDIVTEEIGAYYAGDRTLDQACANIQKRVTIYLVESK